MRDAAVNGRKKWPKSAIVGLLFGASVLALIVYASFGLRRHSCEVCIEFRGQTACRKADGSTLEEARRTATDLACAVLASGMTESIGCSNTRPRSLSCDGKYAATP